MTSENKPVATLNAIRGAIYEIIVRHDRNDDPVDGAFAIIQDGGMNSLYRVGQTDRTNALHDQNEMKGAISLHGKIAHKSGYTDVVEAKMALLSCVDDHGRRCHQSKKSPMGSEVHLATQKDIDAHRLNKEQFVHVGTFIQDTSPLFSLQNRHFGNFDNGGYGEANHYLIGGQNGSGKTTLAAQICAGLLSANKGMGCLIPDTAGDLSQPGTHTRGTYKFNYVELMKDAGREVRVIGLDDIALEDSIPFQKLLSCLLKKRLSATDEKAAIMAEGVAESLSNGPITPANASFDEMFKALPDAIKRTYQSGPTRKDKIEAFERVKEEEGRNHKFEQQYNRDVLSFFEGSTKLGSVIDDVLNKGAIVILQLHQLSNEKHQAIMMEQIFRNLRAKASRNFKIRGQDGMSNALIVLDEGPRWVAQDSGNETAAVIRDSFNTTRKYGLGWMIVTQRLTGISNDVIAQCHNKFVGKGMSVGADVNHIRNLFGDQALDHYNALMSTGKYFWIASGNAVNFGDGSQFVAFETFGGDVNEMMKQTNPQIWK